MAQQTMCIGAAVATVTEVAEKRRVPFDEMGVVCLTGVNRFCDNCSEEGLHTDSDAGLADKIKDGKSTIPNHHGEDCEWTFPLVEECKTSVPHRNDLRCGTLFI
ncbi:hypothetical protein [Millionella massiliensis]|uniref:hypothetical protein n=1 Tax=Millionella massiliensis TaxID=1871023 RepID=UPI00115FEB9C|nr:hypothetical protein [Millionella massiliensis]